MSDINKMIDDARLILKPSKVRIHHVPGWFVKYLKPWRRKYDSHYRTFCRFRSDPIASWMDHYGSSMFHGKECFVSEPYDMSAGKCSALLAFSNTTGLDFIIDSNSWWFPGSTIRIRFMKP